jgi:uncharacterized protein YbaA (DUF1428 family)
MAKYVDGFVLPVPKKKIDAYRALAKKAAKIWIEHGALEYRECVGEDMDVDMGIPFPQLANLKKTETVVFAWIVYKSRAHRDRVLERVMNDHRLTDLDPKMIPFDGNRMSFGGFDVLVEAKASE